MVEFHLVKFLFISSLLLILAGALVSAQSLTDLRINKDVFKIGDELEVNATVSNPSNSIIYLQYLIGPSEGTGQSISNTIEINPYTFETIKVYKTQINEDFRNGDYSILVRLTDTMQNNIYDLKTLNFTIVGLSNEFTIKILVCPDYACSEKSKVFVKGEDIYLNYSSSVANPSINAMLTYPDKTARLITLPTTIKAEQIGTYTLDANASKEGYREITTKEQFGVIGKASEVAYQNISKGVEAGKTGVNKKYLLYALLGILLLILAFIIWYLITHSRGNEVSGQESLTEETQTQNSS